MKRRRRIRRERRPRLESIAAKIYESGGNPSHVAIPVENVIRALLTGLDVQFVPLPPAILADAHQDTVHVDRGEPRPALSDRTAEEQRWRAVWQ